MLLKVQVFLGIPMSKRKKQRPEPTDKRVKSEPVLDFDVPRTYQRGWFGKGFRYFGVFMLFVLNLSMVMSFINRLTHVGILSPFKEVPKVLKILKEKKFKLAILSNGTPTLLNELVKNNKLDNIFDDLFSIEQVGIYKPDYKVYDMPIQKYHIKKNEVAFLSANTWDVSGGGNYGFTSVWVNRSNNIFDNLDYTPKNQITGLNQILDIL